jgi:hypothetical protein
MKLLMSAIYKIHNLRTNSEWEQARSLMLQGRRRRRKRRRRRRTRRRKMRRRR